MSENLVFSKQVRETFEVYSFSAVNSLKICVISECEASLDFFYLKMPNISSLLPRAFLQWLKGYRSRQENRGYSG